MFLHARLRILLSVCASALLLSASAAAQSPVTVSFRALNESGQPVRDLTPAEVTIKVDGKPREVRSLQLVGGEAKPSGPVPARPAFGSNTELGGGRDVILVLDDESLARGKEAPVQVALRQIVGKLNPADRVGVLSLRASGTSIGATADRAVIEKAITDLQGQARTSESLPDLQCRTGQILQTVKALLASAADAKTTFVIVSTGMAPVPNEQMRTTLGRSSGLCNLRSSDFSEVGDAAKGSPAAVYVLFAVDGSNSPSADTAAGLESLAGVTSAPVIRLTGTNAPQIDRIASETAVHYVASFTVEPAERTGSAHKTEIRVTRAGVKTLAGSAMVLAKPGGKSPKDMLASSDAFRDLPLRATGWAMREPGSKVKVIALFEPAEPGVKMASAVIALIDGNKIKAQWTAQSAELERVPVVAALLAPPGNYRLRVAATDASGRGGTVDYPLQGQLVPLGPVTMSGLALGVPDNGFKPRVIFGPDDQGVMGYLELYGVPKGAQVTAAIEIAPSDDAPAIGTTGATVQPANADDMRIVVGGFSITGLQPGDWVMRFVISMDGKVIGTASRTLRKAAK